MKLMVLKTLDLVLLLKGRRQSSTAEVFEAHCCNQFTNSSWNAKGEVVKFVCVI